MSFAYPSVLAFLVVPVLLIAWVWRRTSGRIALPLDHGGQSRGPRLGGGLGLAESVPALILAVVIVLLAGPQQAERAANEARAHEHRVLRRRLEQHDRAARRRAPATTAR